MTVSPKQKPRFLRVLGRLRGAKAVLLRPQDIELAKLPEGWPVFVKSALLATVALAHRAFAEASALAENSTNPRMHLAPRIARLEESLGLALEEVELLRARLARVPPAQRPHYLPTERLRVLILRLARGWSLARAGERLLLSPRTIALWQKRFDEDTLVAPPLPVNRFPDFVTLAVRQLKVTCPALGRRQIADYLARAGLILSESTVRRALLRPFLAAPDDSGPAGSERKGGSLPTRTVTARYPHHVWNIDHTTVPTSLGLAIGSMPFSLPPVFPFAYKVLVVLDHFTREALGLRAFSKEPSGEELVRLLQDVSRQVGHVPKYTVTDKGSQFFNSKTKVPASAFGAWLGTGGVQPRFGAVGRHGSIAVVERFMRTLKSEGTRKLPLISLSLPRFLEFLGDFSIWYNAHRPHSALGGRTPTEARLALPPPAKRLRWEPRPRYPIANPEKVTRVAHLALRVEAYRGRPSLPVVSLQLAA